MSWGTKTAPKPFMSSIRPFGKFPKFLITFTVYSIAHLVLQCTAKFDFLRFIRFTVSTFRNIMEISRVNWKRFEPLTGILSLYEKI